MKTIHLTNAPPVEIVEDEWPIVARALWTDDANTGAAKERAYVRIRRHRDGRYLVYGLREDVRSASSLAVRGGYLVSGHREVTEAIHNTCALVGIDPINLFFDMPAVHA